jgi:hypothetical protein
MAKESNNATTFLVTIALVGMIGYLMASSSAGISDVTGLAFGKPVEARDYCTKNTGADGFSAKGCCRAASHTDNCQVNTHSNGQTYLVCTGGASWTMMPGTASPIDTDSGWRIYQRVTTGQGVYDYCQNVEGFTMPPLI